MCRLRGCSNSFDSEAKIVEWTICIASRVLDRASNESHLGRKPNRFCHDFRSVPEPLFQICRDRQIRCIDNQTCVRKRFIPSQLTVPSTKHAGGSRAGCGQCLEAKASENAGGTNIPRIRNDERTGTLV